MRYMGTMLAILSAGFVSCSGATGSTKSAAAPAKTQISSAKVQGNSLILSATNFAPASTVTLGAQGLKVTSAKATELTATLPESLSAGTYLVQVSGGSPATSDTFVVSIGATGPPGPPGAPGAAAPHFPSGYSILGESPVPPKGFTYTGYSVVSQGGSTGWTLKAPMPTARCSSSVAVVNGIVYVIGGTKDPSLQGLTTVEAYDPKKDLWTTKAPLPTGRYGAGVGVLGGSIYVIAGSQKADSLTGAFEVYSPATDKWTTKTPIPPPKKGVVTAVVNNRLYVLGEFASFSAASAESAAGLEVYDPASDTWTQKAALPTPRSGFSVCVVNNLIYAFGGMKDGLLTTTEAYDPQTDTWIAKAPMPGARKGLALAVINGIVYLAGGSNDSGPIGTTYAYDPMHDTWSNSLNIPISVDCPGGAATEDGVLYLMGGARPGGGMLSAAQAFSPSGPRYYVHQYP